MSRRRVPWRGAQGPRRVRVAPRRCQHHNATVRHGARVRRRHAPRHAAGRRHACLVATTHRQPAVARRHRLHGHCVGHQAVVTIRRVPHGAPAPVAGSSLHLTGRAGGAGGRTCIPECGGGARAASGAVGTQHAGAGAGARHGVAHHAAHVTAPAVALGAQRRRRCVVAGCGGGGEVGAPLHARPLRHGAHAVHHQAVV